MTADLSVHILKPFKNPEPVLETEGTVPTRGSFNTAHHNTHHSEGGEEVGERDS